MNMNQRRSNEDMTERKKQTEKNEIWGERWSSTEQSGVQRAVQEKRRHEKGDAPRARYCMKGEMKRQTAA